MKNKNNNEEIEDTSNAESKIYLENFLSKVDSQQYNGPFTARDSGIMEELHKKLEENAVNYDDEPVTACPRCNDLYLKEIDDKLECFNCGNEISEKDVVVYKSITSYLRDKAEREKDEESS